MIKHLVRKGIPIVKRKGSHVQFKNDHVFTTVPAGDNILKTGKLWQVN